LNEHSLLLANGDTLHFQGLVVAAGVRPRRPDLPGPVARRHALRDLDYALALRPLLRPGTRLVVIGAGFVGCEVAASARGLGCRCSARSASSSGAPCAGFTNGTASASGWAPA
jgi:3-phenylpropionate/trans-cinnamate dioxygenase ferredoxin reductase component